MSGYPKMSSQHTTTNSSQFNSTIDGFRFRAYSRFTVPANGSSWFRVVIPDDRVIATLSREWTSSLSNMELYVFEHVSGDDLSPTPWKIRKKNGRTSRTSNVAITHYTAPPTVGDEADFDFLPQSSGGGGSASGAYGNQDSFRIYAPRHLRRPDREWQQCGVQNQA